MGQPAPPPVVHQPMQQQQQQTPYSTQAADLFNGNSSRSESESTGVISQESGNYNSQVNVNHNTHIGYGVGSQHPITHLYSHMRYNPSFGDYEAVVGISVPLGGKSKKESLTRLVASRRAIEIDNRFRTMSGCANIAKAGMVINYALLAEDDPLRDCQTLTAQAIIELPQQSANVQAQELIQGYQQQQVLIQKLLNRIEQLENENGKNNPFITPG